VTTAAAVHRSPGSRRGVTVALALAASVATAAGLSGIGDAPDPHAPPDEIAAWFVERRSEVLASAPLGYLGAVATVALAARLASGERRRRRPARACMLAGGVLVASYLAAAHITWTALSYRIAASAPDVAAALFTLTIVAVPVLGLGVALLAGTIAVTADERRRGERLLLRGASVVVAAAAVTGLLAVADGGFWSPDVQQQVLGNALLGWLLLLAGTAAFPSRSIRPVPHIPGHQENPG
jgi:hypothetical protein